MENQEEKVKKSFLDKIKHFFKTFNFKEFAKNHIFDLVAIGGFLLCLILFSILPPIVSGPRVSLWNAYTLNKFIEQSTVYLILAIGAVFVYLMGCMDISVGWQVGVFGTVFIMVANASGSIIVGLLVILTLGAICAVFNAFVGAYVKLPTVMSSVILMQLFSGIMKWLYTDSSNTSYIMQKSLEWASSTWFRILSIVVLAIVGFYIITFTKVGKKAKAIGANKQAADQAGANLLKTRITCYVIFSIFLCIAAFFLIARKDGLGEYDSSSFQMDIMIMLLMGGMPLSGGMKGKLSNAIIGTLTYCLIDLGLALCKVPAQYIYLIKSAIFVAIVAATCRKPGAVLPR